MTLPPFPHSRPRRSFGGKGGIWWRKKLIRSSLPDGKANNDKNKTDDSVESSSEQKTEQNKTASLQSTAAAALVAPTATTLANSIGWDPVKCRPIYHHDVQHDVVSSGSDANNNDDDDDDDDDASDESSNNGKMEDFFETAMPPQPHVQRIKRSYGSKKTPFSLFMDSDTVPFESSIGSKKRRQVEQPSSSESSCDFPASSTKELPRQVSEGLEEPNKDSNDRSQPPGISSRRRCRDKHKNNKEQDSSSSTGDATTNDTLDFAPDKQDNNNKVTISKKDFQLQQPSCNTSLLEARAFFERLDATQELKCDSSDTPQVSSKAFRTSRNLHLSSPGLSKEYQAYARASNESGVTPLSIKEYAGYRSGFFRRRDLFEGFLDG
jgi:hypothetical protein